MKKGSIHISEECPPPETWTDREFWECVHLLERLDSSQLFDLSAMFKIGYDERYRHSLDMGDSIIILIDEGSGGKERILPAVREYVRMHAPEERAA